MKPLLSEKKKPRDKINWVKNEEITSDDPEVVNTLNTFFSSIVKSQKIPKTFDVNNLSHRLSKHSTLNFNTEHTYH